MTKRGVVIVSVMLGLFVLSFGALGVRALTLGPDAPKPSANEVATRQQAANSLERSIQTARADVPPALPAVPEMAAAAPGAASATREANPQVYGGEEYEGERYEAEYEDEDEHEDDEHGDHHEEEGDHDDD